MKTLFNKIKHKVEAQTSSDDDQDPEVLDGDVDHLWMREEQETKKETLVKDPRIDTGILRNRIAEKLAKMNNY